MNKFILLIALIVFPIAVSAKKYPGYIIDKEGNRKETTFKVKAGSMGSEPNYAQVQESIYYIEDGQEKLLLPQHCQKIGFKLDSLVVEFKSVPNNYKQETKSSSNYLFLRCKVEGTIVLYYFYFVDHVTTPAWDGGLYTSSKLINGWILQHDDGHYMFIKYGRGSAEEFKKAFFDCDELVSILDKKRIRRTPIEELVMQYNNCKEDLKREEQIIPAQDTII